MRLAVERCHRGALPFLDRLGDRQRLRVLADAGIAAVALVQFEQLVGPLVLDVAGGEDLEEACFLEVVGEAAYPLPAQRHELGIDRIAALEERQVDADELGLHRETAGLHG
jgi:hypothetical protein